MTTDEALGEAAEKVTRPAWSTVAGQRERRIHYFEPVNFKKLAVSATRPAGCGDNVRAELGESYAQEPPTLR